MPFDLSLPLSVYAINSHIPTLISIYLCYMYEICIYAHVNCACNFLKNLTVTQMFINKKHVKYIVIYIYNVYNTIYI